MSETETTKDILKFGDLSPKAASDWLLQRLTAQGAINYAVRCIEGPTLRGGEFWSGVLEILKREIKNVG